MLAERARLFKKTEEGIREMSGVLEEMKEETAKRENKKTDIEMLKSGRFSDSEISRYSFLTEDEVRKLKEDILEEYQPVDIDWGKPKGEEIW